MSNEYKSELSPSEDIVKWLRDERYDVCDRNMRCNGEVMDEAAEEIERLRGLLKNWVDCCFVNFATDTIEIVDVGKVYVETRAAIAKATGGE